MHHIVDITQTTDTLVCQQYSTGASSVPEELVEVDSAASPFFVAIAISVA